MTITSRTSHGGQRPSGATSTGTAGIADVASLAGVSQSTVSNVLNHRERVAAETIDRVERAISMLGYVPNGAARSLAAGRTRSIGLVLSDLGNSLFVDIARGAEQAARSVACRCSWRTPTAGSSAKTATSRPFTQSRVLGTLLTLNHETHYRALSTRRARATVLTLLNFHADAAAFCSAYFDNEAGGRLAPQHLLDTYAPGWVFVGGPNALQPVAERREGFPRTLAAAGVRPCPRALARRHQSGRRMAGRPTSRDTVSVGARWMASWRRPTCSPPGSSRHSPSASGRRFSQRSA